MKDHLKPSLRENSAHFFLPAGTNYLNFDLSPDLTEKSIVDVVSSLKSADMMLLYIKRKCGKEMFD